MFVAMAAATIGLDPRETAGGITAILMALSDVRTELYTPGREATMTHPQKHIDDLTNEADERELVARLTPDRQTRLRNEMRANELRKRISVLKQRIAKLSHDHPRGDGTRDGAREKAS